MLILKELHDRLDTAVADAYGWPADLSDNEILARLVALNKERAQEEARGHVRWLRPEYRVPRFGSEAQKAELRLVGGAMREEAAAASAGPKPLFPSDDLAQTVAVLSALAAPPAPADKPAIATRFRQGRRIAPQVEAVLASLARTGLVSTRDGRSFLLHRAA